MPVDSVPEDDAERYWTVPELAKRLCVSRATVRREIKEGRLSYIDVARSGDRVMARIPDSERHDWERRRIVNRKTA